MVRLAGSRELRDLADVGCLGSLSAGVGVDLGVKDEDVDVLAGGQHVVKAAEADVVGPAVAAEDPAGLLGEVSPCRPGCDLAVHRSSHCLELGDIASAAAVWLASASWRVRRAMPWAAAFSSWSGACRQATEPGSVIGDRASFADGLREPTVHTEAVLGVVLEQGVSPCRDRDRCLLRAVRRGRSGAAPDGGAAGGVGDDTCGRRTAG